MSKQINFTNNDYTNLLQALGPHTAASTPVTIKLNDTEVVARLVVHSKDQGNCMKNLFDNTTII